MNSEVVSSVIVSGGAAKRVLCDMSDGSQWSCTLDGQDWRMEKPSNKDLTGMFKERSKKHENKTKEEKGASEKDA